MSQGPSGEQLIEGASSRASSAPAFRAVDPRSGEPLGPDFAEATAEEIQRAFRAAEEAGRKLRRLPRERHAALLEAAAVHIEALGDSLIARAVQETGLPEARITGERGRTCGQLRLFAEVVRDGRYLDVRREAALPDRAPLPRPDLRRAKRPLGPVVVFGASNFPLAFSVAGGDTASALAAGCPVVVKAHPHHPGTSELVGRAIQAAVAETGAPAGSFSLIQGRSHETGLRLVEHPVTRAVAFTGSFVGGRALFEAASRRPTPVPLFAEMGSTNPVFLLPRALAERGEKIAEGLAGSVTLGVGQFCTNPGLVVCLEDEASTAWLADLERRLAAAPAGTMLHRGIREGYAAGAERLSATAGVDARLVAASDAGCDAGAGLFVTDAATFLREPRLHEEVFGPATLVVRCPCDASVLEVAAALEGQLTATIHGTEEDLEEYEELPFLLEERVGRLVFGGFPTGVEVGHAMQHGGPWPATTDARFTSVGSAAIDRFLRPVCWQDAPERVLPPELRDA